VSAHACGPAAKATAAAEDKAGRHGGASATSAASDVSALDSATPGHASGSAAKAKAAEEKTERDGGASSGNARTGLGSGVVRTTTTGARIDWASLLKRTFREDVLACPCGGRRRVLADILDRAVIVALLRHLGLPTEAARIAPARDPTFAFG